METSVASFSFSLSLAPFDPVFDGDFIAGFIVDFDLKIALLASPRAADSSTPIGNFDGDREELTGKFSFCRPFQGLLML